MTTPTQVVSALHQCPDCGLVSQLDVVVNDGPLAAFGDLVEACRAAFDELLDVTPGDEDGSALQLIRAALRKAGVEP